MRLMQSGVMPSVSDVAEAAQVSRATAYRYFPSQAALVQAAVDEALGPIFGWRSEDSDVEARVSSLFGFAYPQIQAHEATHRAALLMALDQWTRRQAGTLGDEERIVRGNRRGLLELATVTAKSPLGPAARKRLAQSLSLLFGIESIIVLKDIWGLDDAGAAEIAAWAATALVRAALAEQAASPDTSKASDRDGTMRPSHLGERTGLRRAARRTG